LWIAGFDAARAQEHHRRPTGLEDAGMNIRPKFNTLSSRAFSEDAEAAKHAAQDGPVFITADGEATHVLMTIETFRRLEEAKPQRSLAEAIAHPEGADIDFDPPRLSDNWGLRIPDFD
jgi:hypothetical protein